MSNASRTIAGFVMRQVLRKVDIRAFEEAFKPGETNEKTPVQWP
jgi:hypothetical protein